MNQKELSEMTDQELLEEAKKMKSNVIFNALWIGFLFGIILFSVVKNTWGLLTLIPVYFIYQWTKKSKRDEALEQLLKERNLK